MRVLDHDIHALRETVLAPKYNFGAPAVLAKHIANDGSLELVHEHATDGRGLDVDRAERVLDYIHKVWRRPISLETVDAEKRTKIIDPLVGPRPAAVHRSAPAPAQRRHFLNRASSCARAACSACLRGGVVRLGARLEVVAEIGALLVAHFRRVFLGATLRQARREALAHPADVELGTALRALVEPRQRQRQRGERFSAPIAAKHTP